MSSNFDVRQFSSDKILKHLDKIHDWLSGKNPSPITVELDMTNICNHRCPECVSSYFQNTDKSFLSGSIALRIIKELSDAGVRGLIFTGGGEPLCNPQTVNAAKYAHEQGLDVGFITNGSLLNKENIEILLRSCTWIRVSLDASDPQMYQRIHGVNSAWYRKVIKNIKALSSAKKKNSYSCTIGIGYLTCNETIIGMAKIAKESKALGVDYLQFRPMQIHKGGKFDYHWTDVNGRMEECLKYSDNGYKVLFSKHKYDMMKDSKFGRHYEKCFGHQFAAVIAASGKMYICCHLRDYDRYCIGDLNKNSFNEIWNSEQRKKAVENINFKECIPLCRDNTFNQVLWNIVQPKEHANFL